MLQVTKSQRKKLEDHGLLHNRQTGGVTRDQNYCVTCRSSKGRKKTTFVVEDFEILLCLEEYKRLGFTPISPSQLSSLRSAKLVWDAIIQRHGDYNPDATVFIDQQGQAWVRENRRIQYFLETGELLAPRKKD